MKNEIVSTDHARAKTWPCDIFGNSTIFDLFLTKTGPKLDQNSDPKFYGWLHFNGLQKPTAMPSQFFDFRFSIFD
jgi:hypothetical protein